jgi:hypothetical protein
LCEREERKEEKERIISCKNNGKKLFFVEPAFDGAKVMKSK